MVYRSRLIVTNNEAAMSLDQRPFTVGLIQMRCSTDPDDNLARACAMLRQAAKRRCPDRLPARAVSHPVLLPGRGRRAVRPGRADSRPDHSALGALAKETRMVVVGSIFERRAAGLYHNTAVVIDSDGILRGRYRKMHIPDDPLYYEKYYFTPGDLGFQAFDTSCARVGTLVCWDQWYPEAARLTALKGASILFYPTAIGWHPAEKAEFGAAQTSALGNHAAVTRHRQRSLRGGRQPGRPRRARQRRPGILGRLVPGRPVRADHRPSRLKSQKKS